jgi:heme-degrading monooxygenase HmoA
VRHNDRFPDRPRHRNFGQRPVDKMIMRQWTRRVRTPDAGVYLEHLRTNASHVLAKAKGNLGHQFLVRAIGNGLTEVVAISWWASWTAVAAFAGSKPKLSRCVPDDNRFLVEGSETADHYNVMHNDGAMLNGQVLL